MITSKAVNANDNQMHICPLHICKTVIFKSSSFTDKTYDGVQNPIDTIQTSWIDVKTAIIRPGARSPDNQLRFKTVLSGISFTLFDHLEKYFHGQFAHFIHRALNSSQLWIIYRGNVEITETGYRNVSIPVYYWNCQEITYRDQKTQGATRKALIANIPSAINRQDDTGDKLSRI